MNKSYILAEIMMKFAESMTCLRIVNMQGRRIFSRYTASVVKISRTDVGEACKYCSRFPVMCFLIKTNNGMGNMTAMYE